MKRSSTMGLPVRHLLVAFLLTSALCPVAMFAQKPGKHPAYLHALSNLRAARGYLSGVGGNDAVAKDCAQAISFIDGAIDELKKASIDDGKNLNDHPPVEANLPKANRLKLALELLDKAHADADGEEDDPAARGLKARILGNIDSAHRSVDQAIEAAGH
jgi:hypothetical protein